MTTLTFSAAVLQQNVTLHIRDDPFYEGRENFSLVLSTSDSGVVPSPDQVSILITDNDGEIMGNVGPLLLLLLIPLTLSSPPSSLFTPSPLNSFLFFVPSSLSFFNFFPCFLISLFHSPPFLPKFHLPSNSPSPLLASLPLTLPSPPPSLSLPPFPNKHTTVVTVTFDKAIYEVEEDEQVLNVALTLEGQLQRSLQVALVTQDGSAIGM